MKPKRKARRKTPGLAVRRAALAELHVDPANARKHSARNLAAIRGSLKRFGQVEPLVVQRGTGRVIGGNGRLEVMIADGATHADVVEVDADDAKAAALAIALNRTAELAEWDVDALGALVPTFDADLLGDIGFDVGELDSVLKRSSEVDQDEVSEPPKKAVTKLGDVWTLGRHRVVCGDCTDGRSAVVAMRGKFGQMIFTDPPYGVGYTGGQKKRDVINGDHVGTDIYSRALPVLARSVDAKAPLYLWYADGHAAAAAAAAAGYRITAQIIWAKNHAQFVTSAHYKGKHEPCYYAHKAGKTARWHGPNNEVTLWECDRSPSNDYHPTQKPVRLAARAIGNSTKREQSVCDFFLGSGTTLIAAEQLDRVCYGIEIEPRYVDVVVERWQNLTGKKAKRKKG